MKVLVRKVDVLLWNGERFDCGDSEVPATLIQHKRELLARECCLSFWLMETGDPNWEDDAFLAVMGARSNSRLDTMRLAVVELSALEHEVKLRTREQLIDTLVRGVDGRKLANRAQLPQYMKDALDERSAADQRVPT